MEFGIYGGSLPSLVPTLEGSTLDLINFQNFITVVVDNFDGDFAGLWRIEWPGDG